MAIRHFGSGTLYGTRTDVASGTPVMFGTLQDISLEFSGSIKELYGEGQFAVAVARGQSKITGKAKMGQISPLVMSDLFFGTALTSGQTAMAIKEAGMVPAATAYTVTVANSATWAGDLGVSYALTATPLKKVASAPAVGQYSVANGVYTFAAADASAPVIISYTYTVAATGQTLTVSNPQQGIQPVFTIQLGTSFTEQGQGVKRTSLTLFACVSEKMNFGSKQGDWMIPDFDFMCFANTAGNVFSWSFPEFS